jgi:tetratricopeptide (TPR) repeat protein
VDKTLDMFLGKGPPPKATTGDSGSDFVPPPVAAPPLAPGGAQGSDTSSSGGADMSSQPDSGSASSSDSGPSASSSGDDHDEVTINEQKLSPATLKAGELNNEAVTALNNHEFQKAIDLLKQAVATDPTYVQGKSNLRVAYFNYGVELYNEQKYAEALPYIEKAVALSKQLDRDDADMRSLYEDCKQAVKENAGKQ